MSDKPKAAAILNHLLEGTREEEIDCDRFGALLAPFLDGRISDEDLREQIAHHSKMCPECSEELEILTLALEGEKP